MIQATELRIGNWVMTDNSEYWTREYRHTYTEVDIDVLIGVDTKLNLRYDPIPLTPEILEKAGFGKRPLQKPKSSDGLIYGLLNTTIVYGRTTEGGYSYFLDGYHNDVEVLSLHQLQNLYFALTGTELQIEL